MSEAERRIREEAGKARLTIAGMTCATCARNVERTLSGVEGVRFAAVNLATETAFMVLDEPVPMEIIEKAVENAGYEASRENPEDMERNRYVSSRSTLLYSLALTVPLSVLMIMHMSGAHMPWFLPFEAAAAGLVVFGCGWKTIRGAWIAARHLHTNMDTLITLGSTLSWLTSLLALSGVSIASFGAVGAMIMTLHISGRFIESRLRDRASREVKSLLRLQAREARVMVGEEEVMLPIEAVKEGFLVVVRPGERLPVDGVVQRGDSSVDESMITGESIPVRRGEGDDVKGGSLKHTGGLIV
ncbi:MAG: cation transporter, partial [Synergistota bacterium]|nr:cation transporter [Synergistota bacterium]